MGMKIMIAMSGGVDSSVAAALVRDAGHECVGAYMRLWGGESSEDAARASAEALGIPLVAVDMRDIFFDRVVRPFAEAYSSGRTPNPCAICNREIKFGALMRAAERMGCTMLASGHYARIERRGEKIFLRTAADRAKDQSYFLSMLSPGVLSKVVFPLGGMTKAEVRDEAARRGLPSASSKESQDICFVPDGRYAEMVEQITGPCPAGNFVDEAGRVRGRHRGIIRCTVGQHRGLGLPGGEKLYVLRLDADRAEVTVGPKEQLCKGEITASRFSWTDGEPPSAPIRCTVKIRCRHPGAPATATATDGGAIIRFDAPERAPAPGQIAVLMDGDRVLGGGEID